MISRFGQVTREIRAIEGESLRTMATRLGISAAFLSILEVGRKAVPADYADKINDVYHLSNEMYAKLSDAVIETNKRVDFEISEMNAAQKEVSMTFARKIKNADPDLIEKLKKVLEDDQD